MTPVETRGQGDTRQVLRMLEGIPVVPTTLMLRDLPGGKPNSHETVKKYNNLRFADLSG